MIKNKMQTEFTKEMVQVLEQGSMESQQTSQSYFPLELLNKQHLSKGAQRNFDQLVEVMQTMKVGPK